MRVCRWCPIMRVGIGGDCPTFRMHSLSRVSTMRYATITSQQRGERLMSRKKTTPKPAEPEQGSGYKNQHVEGSRKGKVHELFDKEGPEAAWTLGLKLKLKEGTLRTWFG